MSGECLTGSQRYENLHMICLFHTLEEIRFGRTASSQIGLAIPNPPANTPSEKQNASSVHSIASLGPGLRLIPNWSTCTGVGCEKLGSTARRDQS